MDAIIQVQKIKKHVLSDSLLMSKLQRTVKKKRKKTQKPKREDDIPEHLRSFGGKLLFILTFIHFRQFIDSISIKQAEEDNNPSKKSSKKKDKDCEDILKKKVLCIPIIKECIHFAKYSYSLTLSSQS